MYLVNKDTEKYSLKVQLVLPRFIWRRKTRTFRKLTEETTEFNVNLFRFKLTNNKKYFIVELGLVLGIIIHLVDKE